MKSTFDSAEPLGCADELRVVTEPQAEGWRASVSREHRELKHDNAEIDPIGDEEGLYTADAVNLLEYQHQHCGPGDPGGHRGA